MTFAPNLHNQSTSALFPGRNGGPKTVQAAGLNIKGILLKECGIVFNPHAFRHLAAYIFLRANPGSYEIVRRLLGHKRIETTIAFYCGLENDAAFRHFFETVEQHRQVPAASSPTGARR